MAEQKVREWYDYRALRSRDALINIVAGPPRIGKTFGAKLDVCRRGIETDRTTVWIRRSLTELNPAKDGFFDSVAYQFPDAEFRVQGNRGDVKLIADKEWRTIVRFTALSVAYQVKGTEYPTADRIVYDECFAPPGGRYQEDEVAKLRRLWFTINNNRTGRDGRARTRIDMLGNPLELDNPYFLEWGFDGSKEWQKGTDTGGDVVLHLIDPTKYERRITRTMFGGAISENDIEYAEGTYFADDRGMVVTKRPDDAKPMASLVTMRGTYSLWESPDWSAMYVEPFPLAEGLGKLTVAFEPMAVSPGVPLADAQHFVRKFARRYYRKGGARFVGQRALAARQALAR
jgi:hypothetical protein